MRSAPRRAQLTIRMVMASVAAVAVLLAAELTRRRWAFYRERTTFHARMERLHLQKAEYLDRAVAQGEPNMTMAPLAECRRGAAVYRRVYEMHARKRQEYENRW